MLQWTHISTIYKGISPFNYVENVTIHPWVDFHNLQPEPVTSENSSGFLPQLVTLTGIVPPADYVHHLPRDQQSRLWYRVCQTLPAELPGRLSRW